jgi:hypothetical protein
MTQAWVGSLAGEAGRNVAQGFSPVSMSSRGSAGPAIFCRRWLHRQRLKEIRCRSPQTWVRYTENMSRERASDPVIEAYKKDVDRTLLRENMKLDVEQRLRQLMELQKFAEELQRAGRALERRR